LKAAILGKNQMVLAGTPRPAGRPVHPADRLHKAKQYEAE
jgi:hypothetical protein